MARSTRAGTGRAGWLTAVLAAATVVGCQRAPNVPATGKKVYIPGGAFEMGHAPMDGTPACKDGLAWYQCSDFAPVHEVTLSPFLIDNYEVTFGDYQKCIDAGFCLAPWVPGTSDEIVRKKAADPHYAAYPIYGVTPEAAERYCEWQGERLPTEAEWERAARGPSGLDYPWGNDRPTCAQEHDWGQACNPAGSDAWMRPIGSDPRDVSVEGVHDLFGNAFEIVGDLFSGTYYTQSPKNDPVGPKPSDLPQAFGAPYHTVRGRCDGGDWPSYDYRGRGCPVWFRTPDFNDAGFRCAQDAK